MEELVGGGAPQKAEPTRESREKTSASKGEGGATSNVRMEGLVGWRG